jgi:hypothetical protein
MSICGLSDPVVWPHSSFSPISALQHHQIPETLFFIRSIRKYDATKKGFRFVVTSNVSLWSKRPCGVATFFFLTNFSPVTPPNPGNFVPSFGQSHYKHQDPFPRFYTRYPCILIMSTTFAQSESAPGSATTTTERPAQPPFSETELKFLQNYLDDYCTITTLGSRGVTRDGRERHQTEFIGEIFV